MIAGTLEIQMLANMARLADDMAKSKAVVGNAMSDIEKAVGQAKSVLGALGIGLGVGYFVSLVKGSIDAMDHLHDLSKTASLSVETLAGLKVAAKQSGSDLESTAISINKLSVEVGKAPEKFKALGVSAKDPLEQFKQLADISNKLTDVNQRNALLAAALGRAWQGAVPLLAEGSQKIGEMVERGSNASGVTETMAKQADILNDKLVLLWGTGGLITRMIAPLLPLFNTMADDMLKVSENTNKVTNSFSPLLEIMKVIVVLGANVAFTFDTIGKEIARFFGIQASIADVIDPKKALVSPVWALNDALKKTEGIRKQINNDFAADAKARRQEIDDYSAKIMALKPNSIVAGAEPGAGGGADAATRAAQAAAAAKAASFLQEQEQKSEAEKFAAEVLRNAKFAAAAELKLIEDNQKKGEDAREIAHQVLVADNARELAQIALKNKQKEEEENRAWQATLDRIDAEQAAEIAKGAVIMAVDEEIAANKKREQQEQYDATMRFLGDLSSLMNTQSRKAFELGKIASISIALVKGYESAVSAYAAGSKIGGPPLGALFAAASILATTNLINNIRSQTFGGGGGAPTPVGQGASGVGATAPSMMQQPVPTTPSLVLNLTVNGHILDTKEFTDSILVPALRDAIDNRDVTIIGANSRQAADLVGAT